MVARRLPEFTKRGVKVVALSIDTIEDHKGKELPVLSRPAHTY